MKRQILVALAVAAFALVTGAGIATAQEQWLNVPFAFTVAGQTMPAGRYSVEVTESQVVILRQANTAASIVLPAVTRLAVSGASPEDDPRLVFDKVGNMYYLSEFWPPDMDGFLVYGAKEAHTHSSVKAEKAHK